MAAKLAAAPEHVMSGGFIDPDYINLSRAERSTQPVDTKVNVLTVVKELIDRRDDGDAEDSIVNRTAYSNAQRIHCFGGRKRGGTLGSGAVTIGLYG
jgi:hypothetical protein